MRQQGVDKIENDPNNKTNDIDYQNTNDPVLFWFDINLGNGKLKNADITIREKSKEDETAFIHRSPIDGGRKFWDILRKKDTNSGNKKKNGKT